MKNQTLVRQADTTSEITTKVLLFDQRPPKAIELQDEALVITHDWGTGLLGKRILARRGILRAWSSNIGS
jgi:hypothetical protein